MWGRANVCVHCYLIGRYVWEHLARRGGWKRRGERVEDRTSGEAKHKCARKKSRTVIFRRPHDTGSFFFFFFAVLVPVRQNLALIVLGC